MCPLAGLTISPLYWTNHFLQTMIRWIISKTPLNLISWWNHAIMTTSCPEVAQACLWQLNTTRPTYICAQWRSIQAELDWKWRIQIYVSDALEVGKKRFGKSRDESSAVWIYFAIKQDLAFWQSSQSKASQYWMKSPSGSTQTAPQGGLHTQNNAHFQFFRKY